MFKIIINFPDGTTSHQTWSWLPKLGENFDLKYNFIFHSFIIAEISEDKKECWLEINERKV